MKSLDLNKLRNLADLNSMAQGAQEDRVLLLDPDEIVVEKQVRKKFKNIEELAAALMIEQQQPIVVSPLNKDTGKYSLQKGERRLRAARLIGNGFKIKAIVDSTKRKTSEYTASQLIENIQREDLTPIEIGRSLVSIRDNIKTEGGKGTGKDLANLLNKPESWVSRHLSIADVPDELADLIEDEITTDSEIIYSLKQISDLDTDVFKTMIAKARESQITRDEARNVLKAIKAPSTAQAQPGGEGGTEASNSAGAAKSIAPETTLVASPSGSENSVTQTESAETEPAPQNASKKSKPKLGKAEVAVIAPDRMVVFVRVALDAESVKGELLLNKVCGDPSKGVVVLMKDGRQIEKMVPLDQIEIITMQQMDAGE